MRATGVKIVFFWDGDKRPAYKSWTMQKRREEREQNDIDVLNLDLQQHVNWNQEKIVCNLAVLQAPTQTRQETVVSDAAYIEPNMADHDVRRVDEYDVREEKDASLHMQEEEKRIIQEERRKIDMQRKLPLLAKMQVRATLRMLKVEQRDCVMEADLELAVEASGKSKLYVLGNDSDFLLFKDVNYINFYDYQVVGRRSEARVCLRSNIARKLGLTSEHLLVEFSLFIGNDYTKGYEKNHFAVEYPSCKNATKSIGIGRVRASEYGEAFSDFVATLSESGGGTLCSEVNDDLDDALAFSRAYYSLDESLLHEDAVEDIDAEAYSDSDSDSDDEEYIFIGSTIPTEPLGNFVLKQMLKEEKDDVRAPYFEACSAMLEFIDDEQDTSDFVFSTWESLEFAKQYEKKCKYYLKQYPFLQASPLNEPRRLFHGPTFQRELRRSALRPIHLYFTKAMQIHVKVKAKRVLKNHFRSMHTAIASSIAFDTTK